MRTSTKIWLAISGVLLILLGVFCICNPFGTLFAAAWVLGLVVLLTGISRLVFAIDTRVFFPKSGSRVLSAVLEIVLGIILLCNLPLLTAALPAIFVIWLLVEGVIIAVQSFDYRQVRFPLWWVILIFGLICIVLGILGLRSSATSAQLLSLFVGIALILLGGAYLCALRGLNRFSRRIGNIRRSIGAEDQ